VKASQELARKENKKGLKEEEWDRFNNYIIKNLNFSFLLIKRKEKK
jgi:hypothetical protein